MKCTNPNCSCPSHANDIHTVYDSIIKVFSECSKKNWRMINTLVKNVAFLGGMI